MTKLAPRYKEIENNLSHLPETSKNSLLGSVIGAFLDNNPITYLDNFKNNLIKAKTFNEMLNKSALFLGLNKTQTRKLLKMGLR